MPLGKICFSYVPLRWIEFNGSLCKLDSKEKTNNVLQHKQILQKQFVSTKEMLNRKIIVNISIYFDNSDISFYLSCNYQLIIFILNRLQINLMTPEVKDN